MQLKAAAVSPLIVVAGPTASGKSTLALALADRFNGEIISCDSVAMYCGLDIGSAKPSMTERARVPHHLLDVLTPDQASTAGDYARLARAAVHSIQQRGRLPIVVGGTGLYLRAFLHGLAPAPPRDERLRERLRGFAERRSSAALHRILRRLDPRAADLIHPHDLPKLIRSLEVTSQARRPQTEQWAAGRDPLQGFSALQLGLDPPRAALYERINARAAAMFAEGLLEETADLMRKHGNNARVLTFLGYAEAAAVLQGKQGLSEATTAAQTGHRHYSKRQLTWFRREPAMHWLSGFGDEPGIQAQAHHLVNRHLSFLAEESTKAATETFTQTAAETAA